MLGDIRAWTQTFLKNCVSKAEEDQCQPAFPCQGTQRKRYISRLLGSSSPGKANSCTNWSMNVSRNCAQEKPETPDMFLGHHNAKNSTMNAKRRHLCSGLLSARGSGESGAEASGPPGQVFAAAVGTGSPLH